MSLFTRDGDQQGFSSSANVRENSNVDTRILCSVANFGASSRDGGSGRTLRNRAALAIDEQVRSIHGTARPENATSLVCNEYGFMVARKTVEERLRGEESCGVSTEDFCGG